MSTRTSSCILCGCQCKQHSFTINNDPDSISDDIERLDKVIHSLRTLKSQRCRQLNTIRSSTKILPSEILLSIFQYFCSLFKSQDFPQFILGGVCNHWRNLLNSAPQFWKTLDLHVERRTLPKAVSLVEVFKERNGASFEFIQLQFERFYDQSKPPLQRLLQSIREVTTLSRIALHDPPVNLLRIINNNLDTNEMSLSRLWLPSIPGFSLPWSALTTLKLTKIQIDICCDLLRGCPNLIRFESYDPASPTFDCSEPNAHHAQGTSFPQLRHLTWSHFFSEWDNNLLSFYCFPALEHFHWNGYLHWYSLELFQQFISFLPQPCRIFQLSAGRAGDVEVLKKILLWMKHPVEQLIYSHLDSTLLSVALERLQDPSFIPTLTFFKWEHQHSGYLYGERILELTQIFKDILRSRNEICVGRFRMEIGGLWLGSHVDECDRKKTYELMDGGWFDFEMTEDGYWIMDSL